VKTLGTLSSVYLFVCLSIRAVRCRICTQVGLTWLPLTL